MAKFKEKIPEIIVDIDIWDPANGKNHIAVAPETRSDGVLVGTIHMADGATIPGIVPPVAIAAYPGNPVRYAWFKPEDVTAYFEPVAEAPSDAPQLHADNDKDSVPTL